MDSRVVDILKYSENFAVRSTTHVEARMIETKRDAFKRLAEKRTNAILDRIRILGNCANPYAYEYSEEDVRLIFAAIEQEIRLAKTKFANHRRRQFKLEAG